MQCGLTLNLNWSPLILNETSAFSLVKMEWMRVSSRSSTRNFLWASKMIIMGIVHFGSGRVTLFLRMNSSEGPLRLLTE